MSPFEFIAGLQAIEPEHNGCVATIGTFDGVHLGHQAILQRVKDIAQKRDLPSLVIVFEPQPYEFFSKEKAPARITRLRDKVEALRASGVHRVLCLRFNAALRGLTAEAFVEQVLVSRLGVAHLEVGDDFRFGCDRKGDFALLQKLGPELGFDVCDTQTLTSGGQRISSTRVRSLLEAGDIQAASHLLGRPYRVLGKVTHGRKLGRQIGVPTANLQLGRCRAAVSGVYAVKAKLSAADNRSQDETEIYGVANVGVRPTVEGSLKPLLEVHLFDWQQEIYGRCMQVEFCHHLRQEQKFESITVLKAQIHQDMVQAREYFARQTD